LRKKYYAYSVKEIYKGISLSAKKGTFNKIGSIALHLGAIVLFAGGLLSSKLGFVYYKNISPGEVIPVRERAFKLRVDDFKVVTNERGEIKDYLSDLSVIENGSVVLQKRIEVNDPLDYRGIYFYQSSYGQETDRIRNSQLRIQSDSLGLDTVLTVPFGEPILLGPSGLKLITKDFFGDFSIDVKTKQVTNRSFSHSNPAMKVLVTDNKGSEVHSQWLFFTHAHFHSADKGLVRVSAGGYTPVYYTGLQIRKNPGVGLIWAGIITISLGLLLVFYVPVKQIWVLIERKESGCGKCDRFQAGFRKDFNSLVSGLIPESEKR
jgi:cytochrome c biogenesis protein